MTNQSLPWTKSATNQFGPKELKRLETDSAAQIIEGLTGYCVANIVVLRALIELLEHGALEKLNVVAMDITILEKWISAKCEPNTDEVYYKTRLAAAFLKS